MIDKSKLTMVEPSISQLVVSRMNNGDEVETSHIMGFIKGFHGMFNFTPEEADELLYRLETKHVTTMGPGVSLINAEVVHNEAWYEDRKIDWSYWKDYEQLLIRDGWPTRVVSSMNTVTNNILGLLEDPERQGDWQRLGLVIGHVQSGKTANYIGLVTKAADAGYKFIIVIAGIHNNLRTQTQERIDRGFIGFTSDRFQTRQQIGVGKLRPNRATPVTVTTTDSDFKKSLAKTVSIDLKSINNTFILVIKKNTSTLRNLHNWLKELNTQKGSGDKILDIPMLLIDDEADNASINTRKPDLDPTKTNMWIRSILNLFQKSIYVGYTATPFANIFINPEVPDTQEALIGQDLFPRDFIYGLDSPANYFGPDRVFVDEEYEGVYVRDIGYIDPWIPMKHKKDMYIDELPPSLKQAIRLFVLSRAIRNLRDQSNKHHSMMINVTRFVDVQRHFKQVVIDYVDDLRNAVRRNFRLPQPIAERNEIIRQLKLDFESEYGNSDLDWNRVFAELGDAAQSVRVYVINSKSEDALNYTAYTADDNALTAIAIGGLSLSRGLTIEGLTISYMYRNSKAYDTLMQMGRWFGYREGYGDLCRIYMSEESSGWYSHIADATDELRNQIRRMRREGRTPADFGLYVRAHPERLKVTATNKMYYTEGRELQLSYDGKLRETYIVPAAGGSNDFNKSNRSLISEMFDELKGGKHYQDKATSSWLFRDIGWNRVDSFIRKFSFHQDMEEMYTAVPDFIAEISHLYPMWDVSFRSREGNARAEGFEIAPLERTIGYDHEKSEKPRKPPSAQPGWYIGNKNKVSANNMFGIGLNVLEEARAKEFARDAGRKSPIYSDYTNAREKPILVIYLLNLLDKYRPDNDNIVESLVPALSISFPHSSEFNTVKYIVGPVFLRQLELGLFDSPEEEEDYDLDE